MILSQHEFLEEFAKLLFELKTMKRNQLNQEKITTAQAMKSIQVIDIGENLIKSAAIRQEWNLWE